MVESGITSHGSCSGYSYGSFLSCSKAQQPLVMLRVPFVLCLNKAFLFFTGSIHCV